MVRLCLSPSLLRHPIVSQLPELEEVTTHPIESLEESVQHRGATLLILDDEHYALWNLLRAEVARGVSVMLLTREDKLPSEASSPELLDVVSLDSLQTERWNFLITQRTQQAEQLWKVSDLEAYIRLQNRQLSELHEIGISLSEERNINRLIDLIITNCMKLTRADGGSIYLLESIPDTPEDPSDYMANKRLRFAVHLNESRDIEFTGNDLKINIESVYGYTILSKKPLRIDDVYELTGDEGYSWGGAEIDRSYAYRTKSMLCVPMLDSRNRVIGVIQLINKKSKPGIKLGSTEQALDQIRPFTEEDQRLIQSVASQASTAVQNAELVDSISLLFDGFINASVKAIESRDPTTSGHSSRVATLTIALAEIAHQSTSGTFSDVYFTGDQLAEIRYASLLHDFGKIGVRESVLVKAKKLYPEEQQSVMDRFRIIRQGVELQSTRKQLDYMLEKSREDALALIEQDQEQLRAQLQEIDEYLKFVIRANEPTVLAQGGFEKLQEIGGLRFLHPSQLPMPYLTPHEVQSLSVPKGSLNEQDRQEIESHVTHTYNFLSIIPWSSNLGRVPEIAYAHHEKLNGSGYPRKLTAEEIPIQSKMMTISDIYDALTAWDRPYKKAMPAERALQILEFEAKDGHVDRDLLNLFIDSKIYHLVRRPQDHS